MATPFDATQALSFDAHSLDQLKLQAKSDPNKAIGAVSKQFEVLFLNMMLKSMRDAVPQDGMFDSEQTRMYTSLLDQQLAQHMATRGVGLADVMARQLSKNGSAISQPGSQSSVPASAAPAAFNNNNATLAPGTGVSESALTIKARELINRMRDALKTAGDAVQETVQSVTSAPLPLEQTREFVNRLWQHAADAARTTGIQAHFMIGQAALESGWGRHEMRAADGTPSHNLFGVKAGRDWTGPVVEKSTTEYANGVPQTTTAKFRVYDSYADAFRDYAKLLLNNPRYGALVGQAQDSAGFARGLQKAGYATDPAYADKLIRVINSDTMRRSLGDAQAPAQL